jgi:hypothetical protein
VEGAEDDDNETPPPPMPDGEKKDAIGALLSLSSSMNGYARNLVDLARGIKRLGFTPQIRGEVGRGLRSLRDEIGQVADVVDPRGTTDAPPALPR